MSLMVPFGLLDYERCYSLVVEELLPVLGEIRTLVPNLFCPIEFLAWIDCMSFIK